MTLPSCTNTSVDMYKYGVPEILKIRIFTVQIEWKVTWLDLDILNLISDIKSEIKCTYLFPLL